MYCCIVPEIRPLIFNQSLVFAEYFNYFLWKYKIFSLLRVFLIGLCFKSFSPTLFSFVPVPNVLSSDCLGQYPGGCCCYLITYFIWIASLKMLFLMKDQLKGVIMLKLWVRMLYSFIPVFCFLDISVFWGQLITLRSFCSFWEAEAVFVVSYLEIYQSFFFEVTIFLSFVIEWCLYPVMGWLPIQGYPLPCAHTFQHRLQTSTTINRTNRYRKWIDGWMFGTFSILP